MDDSKSQFIFLFSNTFFFLIILNYFAFSSVLSTLEPSPLLQCASHQFSCGDSCIPIEWRCDKSPDCQDESDEKNCPSKAKCQKNKFRCDNGECISKWDICSTDGCQDGSHRKNCPSRAKIPVQCESDQFNCIKSCIPAHWRCDGKMDCEIGTDEEDCNCFENTFRCKDFSKCIRKEFVCDGEVDCVDGSDEQDCHQENNNCTLDEIMCLTNGSCISSKFRCNGVEDCPGGNDEVDCPRLSPLINTTDVAFGNCGLLQSMCKNRKCVYDHDICDGEDDCGDRSDEQNCPRCRNSFSCGENVCIPNSWKCDGKTDCFDGSDEINCHQTYCTGTEFNCTNGKCISESQRCNGLDDCGDRSDEKGCHSKKCSTKEFDCLDHCIPKSWQCDGQFDCNDGADEVGCVFDSNCDEDQWKCKNGKCISTLNVCDSRDDCGDRSDERNCSITTCGYNKFDCGNSCIPLAWRCDEKVDCPNGSDENNCPSKESRIKRYGRILICGEGTVPCADNSGCISIDYKCDSFTNCRDGSDEAKCLGINNNK